MFTVHYGDQRSVTWNDGVLTGDREFIEDVERLAVAMPSITFRNGAVVRDPLSHGYGALTLMAAVWRAYHRVDSDFSDPVITGTLPEEPNAYVADRSHYVTL